VISRMSQVKSAVVDVVFRVLGPVPVRVCEEAVMTFSSKPKRCWILCRDRVAEFA
jgi:hypothetical protein